MKRFFLFISPLILLLSFVVCGKKGPLLPPLPRIIQKIEVLELSQKGRQIILEWENPAAYVDGSPVSGIKEVEIWLLEIKAAQQKKPSLKEFENNSRLVALIQKERFSKYLSRGGDSAGRLSYPYELKKEDFDKELIFGLRVREKKKRRSVFSLCSARPVVLSLPPEEVRTIVREDRIEIRWEAAKSNIDGSSPARFQGFNIYRAVGESLPRRLNSHLIKELKYSDRDFLAGKVYRYFVRASTKESSPFFESGNSEVAEAQWQDVFPPTAPSGLVSIVAGDYISLSWDENQEEDLAGYRVWRKKEGEKDYVLLTPESIVENAFNDASVEKSIRYDYAITALDTSGNESKKSESISEIIKDGGV